MAGDPEREEPDRQEPDREEQGAVDPPAPPRAPDPEALLCGLVLAPDAWSRNRLFALYEDPRARRARRRAQQVRSVIALLRRRGGDLGEVLPPATGDEDGEQHSGEEQSGEAPAREAPAREERVVEIVIDVPAMNLIRRTRLSPLELSLVRYVLRHGEAAALAHDRARVEQALGRLMLAPS